MKIGLIGLGSIGERHYKNLLAEQAEVVIFSRRSDVKGLPIESNWKKFAAHGRYDVIFITNETAKHLKVIRRAVSLQPKAIFVEKPLAVNSAGLDQLVKTLSRKKISLWVGYNMHFFKPLVAVKEIIDSKKLGKILHLRASVGQDLREWRKRDYRQVYSSSKKNGGGVLLDLVHDINYPSWLLGADLKVKAAVVRKISSLAIDVEDCAESIFTTQNGTIVSVHQDYCRQPGKRSLEVIGEKGSVEWDSISQNITTTLAATTVAHHVPNAVDEMYQSEIRFFLGRVKSGKYFSNATEAIRDLKIIEQIKKYGKK